MRQDDRKDIQSVTSAWSIFNSDLKSCINSYLQGNIIGHKMNIPYKHINWHTYIHTYTHPQPHPQVHTTPIHACTHILYTYIYTHTHTHTHPPTHTHTHTHTNTEKKTGILEKSLFIYFSWEKAQWFLWYLNSTNIKSYKVLYQFCWFSDTSLTGARINNEKWV